MRSISRVHSLVYIFVIVTETKHRETKGTAYLAEEEIKQQFVRKVNQCHHINRKASSSYLCLGAKNGIWLRRIKTRINYRQIKSETEDAHQLQCIFSSIHTNLVISWTRTLPEKLKNVIHRWDPNLLQLSLDSAAFLVDGSLYRQLHGPAIIGLLFVITEQVKRCHCLCAKW